MRKQRHRQVKPIYLLSKNSTKQTKLNKPPLFPRFPKSIFFYNQKVPKSFLTFRHLSDFQNPAPESLIFLPLLVAVQRLTQLNKIKGSMLCCSHSWLKGFWDGLMVMIVFSYWFFRWLYFIYGGGQLPLHLNSIEKWTRKASYRRGSFGVNL